MAELLGRAEGDPGDPATFQRMAELLGRAEGDRDGIKTG